VNIRSKRTVWAAAIYLGYAVVILLFGFPALWVASLSLRPLDELFVFPPSLLPRHPTLDSFQWVLTQSQIGRYLLNSAIFVAATVGGALLTAIPSAYAFSRLRFPSVRLKESLMVGVLAVQLISPIVIGLPLYRYFASLGLINSRWAVALVYIAAQSPFATWMLKGFLDTIPSTLDEAARIDGCSRLQALRLVLLPISLPGITACSIILCVTTWGQFIIPFILLNHNDSFPISVGILDFQSTIDSLSTNHLAAAAVLSALPAMVIFIVMQRFILGAMMAGAVKG
jgi:multiple sugar transport system permease protein